jgi:hypothetical protein
MPARPVTVLPVELDDIAEAAWKRIRLVCKIIAGT